MRKTIKISLFTTFLLIGVIFNVGSASALKTTAVYASADTYVNSDQPIKTYGTTTSLTAGYATTYYDNYSAYFRFSLSNQPTNLIKTEISLNIDNHDSGSKLALFKVNLIEESWDESTLNFDNRPNPGDFITNLSVTTDKYYYIDITQYTSGRSEISISLEGYINQSLVDYIVITSRENLFDKPFISFTYDDPMEIIIIIITVLVIIGVLAAAVSALFLYRKRLQNYYSRETPAPFEQGVPDRRQKKSDKICWYCEKAIPKDFNVCPNCGAELE